MRAILLGVSLACICHPADARVQRHFMPPVTAAVEPSVPLAVAATQAADLQDTKAQAALRQDRFLTNEIAAWPEENPNAIKVKLHVNRVKISAPIDLNLVN